MLKKIIITLLGIAVILGGLVMYNYFRGEKMSSQYEREQDRMVEYLVTNYEDIEKVEFTSFSQNIMTGIWSVDAVINNQVYVTFSINHLNSNDEIGFGEHIKRSSGNRLTKREIPESSEEVSSVEVIYFGE